MIPTSRSHRASNLGLAALLATATLTLVMPEAAAATTVIPSAGPLSNIWIGDDLACQVQHVNDPTAYEFYPPTTTPGDCGTFLATGGTLYAPNFAAHGTTATAGLGAYTAFAPVSQTGVTGAGTAAAPFQIVTVVNVGGTCLQITETDRYVVGDDFYTTDVSIANSCPSAVAATVWRAGDCYLGGSDTGFGWNDPANPGSVACTKNAGNTPAGRVEEWIPLTPGSSYMEDNFNTIWTTIGAKTPFANTCTCATLLDNGAGLSWDLSIPAHASVTVSHKTLFSIPPQGNPVSCLADAILVTERDALGGSGRTPYSESNATTAAVPGVYALPPGPWPSEPPTAQAHADARLHGVDYANALVGVSATTVYSKCDVNAVNDPGTGLNTDAYGIGGAEDLRLTILGNAVTLDALDFEMQAFGSAPGTNAFWTCDAADVGLNPPPPTAALCGGPGPVVFCTGLLATVCGSVTVTYNEVLGPTPLPGGRTEYQGSLVHVHVDPLVAGAAVTDVYLGYVDLVVTGGPFTAPPVYVPHAGCVTPVCT